MDFCASFSGVLRPITALADTHDKILEGIATVAIAILGVFALQGCDGPEVAGFLTPEERCVQHWSYQQITHPLLNPRAFISQRQSALSRLLAASCNDA